LRYTTCTLDVLKIMARAGGRHIAIVQGHPDPGARHFGHALADAYAIGAREAGRHVEVIEVATLDFPFLHSRNDLESEEIPEVIRTAQSIIGHCDHLLLIYPVWNGGTPAILRAFLEQTFRPHFMFPDTKPGESLGFVSALKQRKAVAGKSARIVATMAMPAWVYRWYFHPHPERNTLRLSGMNPVNESLIGLVEAADGRQREKWLRTMRQLGREGR
jgi:putative NADPH-quinone reductase